MAEYSDNDLYSDSDPASAPAETGTGEEGGSTSVLPVDFFQGKVLEPGARCEVEVVRVHDDAVEVKYIPHEETEPVAEEPMVSAPPADSEMAAMME